MTAHIGRNQLSHVWHKDTVLPVDPGPAYGGYTSQLLHADHMLRQHTCPHPGPLPSLEVSQQHQPLVHLVGITCTHIACIGQFSVGGSGLYTRKTSKIICIHEPKLSYLCNYISAH